MQSCKTERKGESQCLDFDIRNDACAYRSGCEKEIEARPDEEFPKTVKESGGLIRLYKNHNPGFSFGFMKEYPKLVELIPVCMLSAVAGAWAYVIGKKGRVLEKTALTLVLAGGASNLYDRLKRGYVVDYFSIQWKKLKKWSSTWVISLFCRIRPVCGSPARGGDPRNSSERKIFLKEEE